MSTEKEARREYNRLLDMYAARVAGGLCSNPNARQIVPERFAKEVFEIAEALVTERNNWIAK